MKRFVFGLICAVVLTASAANAANYGTTVGEQFVQSVEQQVVSLPQDADKWYLTLILVRDHRTTPVLRQWFESEPSAKDESGLAHLCKLRAQCHYHVYFTDETIYKDRYAPYVKTAPTILLQRADGSTVFRASWPDMPLTPEALYNGVRVKIVSANAVETRCPNEPAPPAPVIPLKLPTDDLSHTGPPAVTADPPATGGLIALSSIGMILSLFGIGGGGSIATILIQLLIKYLSTGKLDAVLNQYVAAKSEHDDKKVSLLDELAKAKDVVLKIESHIAQIEAVGTAISAVIK